MDIEINNTHKYILFEDGTEALFDLSFDPLESTNLLNSKNSSLNENDNLMMEELKLELSLLKTNL